MCFQFALIILCQKEIGTIAAHKMLVKLTPSVNFTKILQTAFSFDFFVNFYELIVGVSYFLAKKELGCSCM